MRKVNQLCITLAPVLCASPALTTRPAAPLVWQDDTSSRLHAGLSGLPVVHYERRNYDIHLLSCEGQFE
jgi:hypothetical protein